jgi:hypothetical protein
MHSATMATGRPLPPPGKSLPKIRPVLFIDPPLCPRQAHADLPPQKSYPEHTFIQNFRNCMNRNEKRFSNRNKTDVSAKYRFPRTSDDTRKSPVTGQARQSPDGRSQAMTQRDQGHRTPTTSHQSGVTNRSITLSARREGAITTHCRSNRHLSQVSASRQLPIADAHRPKHNISNRQWQILEINVNLSKQTTAPRSNRHKNAILNCQNLTPQPRATNHGSQITSQGFSGRLMPRRRFNRGFQIARYVGFRNVSAHSGLRRITRQVQRFEVRHNQDFGLRRIPPDQLRRGQTVHLGHRNIQQDNVRLQLRRFFHRVTSVVHLGAHRPVLMHSEQHFNSGPNQCIVVRNQDSDGCHRLFRPNQDATTTFRARSSSPRRYYKYCSRLCTRGTSGLRCRLPFVSIRANKMSTFQPDFPRGQTNTICEIPTPMPKIPARSPRSVREAYCEASRARRATCSALTAAL